MLVLRVGDVEIAQVRECEGELFKRGELLPESGREAWLDNEHWLVPEFWDPATDDAWACSQTYAILSGGRKILVDTGIGNGRPRPMVPIWDQTIFNYLAKTLG